MNEHIFNFIQKQTCATICCVDEQGQPYCFNCFFAFSSDLGLLYFKSTADSYHSALMKKNPLIAGTILPDKLKTLLVQGIQFEGEVLNEHRPLMGHASAHYHKKHPMALAMSGDIWTIRVNHIKMTDSTKGFGKKIVWNRDEHLNLMEG
jgi:uncharacterized protein YhbP (UPF0306 family)